MIANGLCIVKLYVLAHVIDMMIYTTLGRSVSRTRPTKSNRGDHEVWLNDLDGGKQGVLVGDVMLSDTPGRGGSNTGWGGDTLSCPAPPSKISKKVCSAKKCRSDTECHIDGIKCCYNGCVYTCMSSLPPPKLIDWIIKPTSKTKSGGAWLLDGEEQNSYKNKVELCSTDNIIEDADPLLCPHGYLCHIDQPGDTRKGIPNKGTCVPLQSHLKESHRKYLFNKTKDKKGSCLLEGKLIRNGGSYVYNHHPCECKSGSLICSVGVSI